MGTKCGSSHPLVNIEFSEDLSRIKEMGVINNPVGMLVITCQRGEPSFLKELVISVLESTERGDESEKRRTS